jgi:uncharacterized membrane protein
VTDIPPPPPFPPPSGPPPGAGGPDAGAALSYGWKKFQENVGPLLAVVLIPVAVQVIVGAIGQSIKGVFALVLFQLIAIVVSSIAGLGIYRVALMITAGEPVSVGKAFQYDRMAEWVVFSVVFGLGLFFGLALCIIPGVLFLAYFGLAPFYFLDGGLSLGEAFSASREAVSSKGLAFPILLSIIVGVLGVIACIVGVLVTEPIAYIAVAYLYRYAAGQPVAA